MIRLESALRPRDFAEVCDAAVETLRRDAAVHVTATLLVNAPLAACLLGLLWAKVLGGRYALLIFPLAAAAAILTVARPLALGAVAIAARERVERGRAPSLAAAWRGALGSGMQLAFAGVVFWIVSLVGGLTYVIPGLVLGGLCALAVPSAALESPGAFAALGRSLRLGKGYLGRSIGILVFSLVLYAAITANAFFAVQLSLALAHSFLGIQTAYYQQVLTPSNGLFTMAVLLGVHVLVDPWKACALYHLHLDARVRHEALDLLQAIDRIGRAAPAGGDVAPGAPMPEAAGAPGRPGAAVAALSLALALVLGGAAPALALPDGAPRDAQEAASDLGEADDALRRYLGGDEDEDLPDAERARLRERISRALAGAGDPWIDEPMRGLSEGQRADEAEYQDAARLTLERVRAAEREVRRVTGDAATPRPPPVPFTRPPRASAGSASGRSTGARPAAAPASEEGGDDVEHPAGRRAPARSPEEARAVVRGVLVERQFQEQAASPDDVSQPFVGETLGSWWQRGVNWFESWWKGRDDEEPSWFVEWLRGLEGPLKAIWGLPWRVIGTALLIVAAALLLRVAARFLRSPALLLRRGAPGPGVNPLIADAMSHEASHFRREGDRLLDRGDARGAVRAYYVGILSALHHRRLLKLEHSQTNWEHMARLASRPDLRAKAVPPTRLFDHVWYGRLEAGREDALGIAAVLDEIAGPRALDGLESEAAAGRAGGAS